MKYLKNNSKLLLSILFIVGFTFFNIQSIKAATITWDGSESVTWATDDNWVGGTAPVSGDDVVINGSYASAPTLDLTGGSATFNSVTVGSSADSILTISNSTTTKKLITTANFTIGANGTTTHTANGGVQTHSLVIDVGGDALITGYMDVNGKGHSSGQGPGTGGTQGQYSTDGGASYGGLGTAGYSAVVAGSVYGSLSSPAELGSGGGGSGSGSGGGAIKLSVTGTLTVNGWILSRGGDASLATGDAGGSGGSIWLVAGTITVSGTIAANGGDGGMEGYNSRDGGSGGGGRIAIYYTTNTHSGTVSVYGSSMNAAHISTSGTVYDKDTDDSYGSLTINNNGNNSILSTPLIDGTYNFKGFTASGLAEVLLSASDIINTETITLSASSTLLNTDAAITVTSSFTISNGAQYEQSETASLTATAASFTAAAGAGPTFWDIHKDGSTPTFTSATIASGATLTHSAQATAHTYSLKLAVSGNMTVTGDINVNDRGYRYGQGPGTGGTKGQYSTDGGASYGGLGTLGYGIAAGVVYGYQYAPIDIGSGGGGSTGSGSGGGAIKLIAGGIFTVNGSILSSGGDAGSSTGDAGGSGGSIWIEGETITGSGTIAANGGDGGVEGYSSRDGGGGGGGRMIIYHTLTESLDGTITVTGGNGNNNGMASDGTLNRYATYGELVSSPYNTEDSAVILEGIVWIEDATLPATTTVTLYLRTGSNQANLLAASWSEIASSTSSGLLTTGATKDTGTVTVASTTLPAAMKDGSDDQWIQYKVAITSTTASTPTITSIQVSYISNSAPSVQGVTASQDSDGNIDIVYAVLDSDTDEGSVQSGYITPSFEYSLDNGSTWTTITTGLNSTATNNVVVTQGSYATYTATWLPRQQIDGNYAAQGMIRAIASDGEAANAIGSSTSIAFALDAKSPAAGSPAIVIVATTTPASLTISATDDTSMTMKISLDSDFSSGSFVSYNSTSTVSLVDDPDTVYIQFKDANSNSTTASILTPNTPANVMIQDTTNVTADPDESRLFIAWSVVDDPAIGFSRYEVYRSTDQSTYTLVGSSTTRTLNYYGDNSVAASTTYYYKVATLDTNGNTSYMSSAVYGLANGI